MPTVMLEVPDSATVGDVRRVPLSRAQAVLLERAAREIATNAEGAKAVGLSRELAAIAAQWRALAGVEVVDQMPDLELTEPEEVVP